MAPEINTTPIAPKKKLHIAVFPWLAFGHMIPFHHLANLLAAQGHHISFLSTPRNIHRLPKTPPKLSHSFNFVPLHLPQIPGLPPAAESTADLPPGLVPYLKLAHDGLEPADFTVPPKWVPFPSSVAYRLHEARRFFEPPPEGVAVPVVVGDLERGEAALNGCDVLALRTCPELERDWLDLTGQLYGKPVVPAGLLIPSEPEPEPEPEGPWVAAREWLGKQRFGSVVYVAFGSEVSLTKYEMTELALGLELAGFPFLWVLRKQGKAGSSAEEEDGELLPEGFEDRIQAKGIGLVHTGWAPQVQILAHGSVGGFLTHCGWGSVVEALRFGRPLIMLPIQVVDQGLIARTFAERGAGVEVARDEEDGYYSGSSVAESVRAVMGEESGRRYRDKAEEMRAAVFGNTGVQDRCFRGFVEFLENYSRNNNV
ncbi:unnamed protein product [Linum tenue]|uniref:Glycosyltransferase n=1 Tax=Linum tenue TaxID=586396 RepID=A0AAV0ICB4_9ROSI|nr:unnamed protein product [Linum tenue]